MRSSSLLLAPLAAVFTSAVVATADVQQATEGTAPAGAPDIAAPDVAAAAPPAQAPAGPIVEVRSRASVTVVGRFESLREVVEQLCRQSGVRLRTFTADDREVVARYRDVSLRQAFERLLGSESFALGFKKPPGDEKARITWIRVFGSKAGEAAPARAAAAVLFPSAALTDVRAPVRKSATQRFVRRMQAERGLRDALVQASDRTLMRQLSGKPYADEFLAEVHSQARSPRIRAKLAALRVRLSR